MVYLQFAFRYFWAGIGEHCDETMRRCDVCQRSSKKFKPFSTLHPTNAQNTVWLRIGIDLLGPLPETSQGNKYLITYNCYIVNGPRPAPLKTKSAERMDEFHIFFYAQKQKNNFLTFRTSNCIVMTHPINEKT